MRFTQLAIVLAGSSSATRPDARQSSVSMGVARVGDLLSHWSSAEDSLAALKSSAVIVEDMLLGTRNATEHMSDDDQELLREVIDLVQDTIYGSMDQAHMADQANLDNQVAATAQCNTDIELRQSSDGDLGRLQTKVIGQQTELDRLQAVVDDETTANNTAWNNLDAHMQHISVPPTCPGLPDRTKPSLDVFFESSDYSNWYTFNQASYAKLRDEFVAADDALKLALTNYNTQMAVRDVQYCDWKGELEAACKAFDRCFSLTSSYYTDTLVPRVKSSMNSRKDVYKAGEELVHQIKFLLGDVTTNEAPETDTGRYELIFKDLPEKGPCDLTVLDADIYVPKPECATGSHKLVEACSGRRQHHQRDFPSWGDVRTEADNQRAGEAVCCNSDGKSTRHVANNVHQFVEKGSHALHENCTTPDGNIVTDASGPSHTFIEARAICESAGLSLCRNQQEVDTSCHTGCHMDAVLAWIEEE